MTTATEPRLDQLRAELAHVSRDMALGSFATSLAHELNQPLTAIANYLETFKDLIDTPRPDSLATIRDALDECAEQSVRAGRIVRKLRDFVSRGATVRRVERLEPVVVEAARLALAGTSPRLETAIDSRAPLVRIDRVQVQQVIVNLVRNAAQALEDRREGLIRIASRARPGGEVELSVEDNGPGLSPVVSAQLFQPFVGTRPEGLGLGLSICRTIVEANGGRIWAAQTSLGGAAFRFTLPGAAGDEHG